MKNLFFILLVPQTEAYVSVGRNPEDPATSPELQKYRFIGDLGLLEKLKGEVYNDTFDPKKTRIWRLLLERGGRIYLFRTLADNAALDERPLVLAIKEGDSGEPLMILSPEYTKPRSN